MRWWQGAITNEFAFLDRDIKIVCLFLGDLNITPVGVCDARVCLLLLLLPAWWGAHHENRASQEPRRALAPRSWSSPHEKNFKVSARKEFYLFPPV